jgi:hypothetical protein
MARLTLPDAGTIIHVEGDLEQTMRASGWVDVTQDEATPEKPKATRKPGRPKKSE